MSKNPTYNLEKAIISASVRLYYLMDGSLRPGGAVWEILADGKAHIDPDRLTSTEEGCELFLKWRRLVAQETLQVQSVDPEGENGYNNSSNEEGYTPGQLPPSRLSGSE